MNNFDTETKIGISNTKLKSLSLSRSPAETCNLRNVNRNPTFLTKFHENIRNVSYRWLASYFHVRTRKSKEKVPCLSENRSPAEKITRWAQFSRLRLLKKTNKSLLGSNMSFVYFISQDKKKMFQVYLCLVTYCNVRLYSTACHKLW